MLRVGFAHARPETLAPRLLSVGGFPNYDDGQDLSRPESRVLRRHEESQADGSGGSGPCVQRRRGGTAAWCTTFAVFSAFDPKGLIPKTGSPSGLEVAGESSRPAVFFLHGFMGSKSDWAGVVEELAPRFRCVAVDLPGHGAALNLPSRAYTMEGAAEKTLSALDELGVPRATFVGYSMGGRLALYLALRYPGRCSGLLLESSSPGIEDVAGRRARREVDEKNARRLESGDLEAFLRDWYRQPLFAPLARDEALLRRTMEARRRNDPAELARSLRGMGTGSQPSLWEELPGLRVPVLALAGGLDEKFVGVSRRMESLAERLRVAVVPGVGHNVRLEKPAGYLALLRGFLDGLSRPPER